jgi:ubiquinone/menaquinone biosynthesis C-methylase UbiE
MDFPWPTPQSAAAAPVWTGRGFAIGAEKLPLLSYLGGPSGWSDGLTELHEDAGGAAHPMDVASRNRTVRELKRYLPAGNKNPVLLEVGCSSGFLLPVLREHFPGSLVIGSDYVGGPLKKLSESMPDMPLLQFDLVRCPLPDACVDGAVLLNVLEHIEDDNGAMKQLHRVVKPGGVVYIEVPAGPHLFDLYDKHLMHFRRYEMKGLKDQLRNAGFEVLSHSHLGFACYPGFWWTKRQNAKYEKLSEEEKNKLIHQHISTTRKSLMLSASLALDTVLDKIISLPWGVRCVVTCRRPSASGAGR